MLGRKQKAKLERGWGGEGWEAGRGAGTAAKGREAPQPSDTTLKLGTESPALRGHFRFRGVGTPPPQSHSPLVALWLPQSERLLCHLLPVTEPPTVGPAGHSELRL